MRLMTFFAQHGASYFRLKRNAVVFAAMVADNFETRLSISTSRSFFTAAGRATLRLWHISLIKQFLLFFGKKKNLFTLNAWNFKIGHCLSPFNKIYVCAESVT
jgi:hypothetical protein